MVGSLVSKDSSSLGLAIRKESIVRIYRRQGDTVPQQSATRAVRGIPNVAPTFPLAEIRQRTTVRPQLSVLVILEGGYPQNI